MKTMGNDSKETLWLHWTNSKLLCWLLPWWSETVNRLETAALFCELLWLLSKLRYCKVVCGWWCFLLLVRRCARIFLPYGDTWQEIAFQLLSKVNVSWTATLPGNRLCQQMLYCEQCLRWKTRLTHCKHWPVTLENAVFLPLCTGKLLICHMIITLLCAIWWVEFKTVLFWPARSTSVHSGSGRTFQQNSRQPFLVLNPSLHTAIEKPTLHHSEVSRPSISATGTVAFRLQWVSVWHHNPSNHLYSRQNMN